ncbi:hypothetical protein F5Y14DRAFT_438653 [Nemania sp. NC0429]|nr:hypothetical protein F5Y14DRAFT_438653 [Nemania sp. NC0429]
MSVSTNITHPHLSLVEMACSRVHIREHFDEQMLQDRYNGLDILTIREIILPVRLTQHNPDLLLENAPFPFERLPVYLQCRIWKLLIPNGELIHCLSRLDPRTPPLDCEPGKVDFPSRFHIGNERCCVAKADKPSRFLNYFLVSKRWFYATAHMFYATNTFAFSSLGEFGRFCSGIKRSRVQRLVNIELMWHGALTPRQDKGVSLRKQPLHWFMHTKRLRTLVVHINESAKWRIRRPYEMLDRGDFYEDFTIGQDDEEDEEDMDIFALESRRTDTHPNYRKNRSLRTVQGMDFIYGLRGMKWVHFYDTNADRAIRDWSFSQDINNVVKRDKTQSATLKAEIDNLRPLTGLADFQPDDETRELVAHFYDETPVEDVSVGGSETFSSSRSTGSSDSFDSSSDGAPGGSSRSVSDTNASTEIADSDTPMDDDDDEPGPDDDDQPSDIDLTEIVNFLGRSSHSGSGGGGDAPDNSGVNGASAPQPSVIVIDDDDGDENDTTSRRTGGYHSTDSGLFVRSGSGTAPESDNSGVEANAGGGGSYEYIDLTRDDEDLVDQDHEENSVQEAREVLKIDDDDKDEDDKNDDENNEQNIKVEISPSRSSSSQSGSGRGTSVKRSSSESSQD